MTSFDTPRNPSRVCETTELFSMLPALFGFEPHESLIAITTYGPHGRVGFRLRIDIPEADDIRDTAAQIAGHVAAQNPEAVILLVLSAHDEPADSFITAVIDEVHLVDVPILEMARGDGQRCRSYLCDDEGCCPPEGTSYADRCSAAVAQAVFDGQQILQDRDALVRRLSGPTGPLRSRMQAAFAEVSQNAATTVAGQSPGVVFALSAEHLDPIITKHLGAHDGVTICDDEVAEFAVWITSVAIRDVIWSRMNEDNARDWLELLIDMAQRVVEPFEPAVLSLTAFAAWLCGDGVQALIAVERAAAADEDYSMAQLILQLVEAGISPTHWETFAPNVSPDVA